MSVISIAPGRLTARIAGCISGEVIVCALAKPRVKVGGRPLKCAYDAVTRTVIIPYAGKGELVVHDSQLRRSKRIPRNRRSGGQSPLYPRAQSEVRPPASARGRPTGCIPPPPQ